MFGRPLEVAVASDEDAFEGAKVHPRGGSGVARSMASEGPPSFRDNRAGPHAPLARGLRPKLTE